MGSFGLLQNDPSRIVLHPLQLHDAVLRSAVEHSVAVVDPRQDQTTSQRLCEFRSQKVPNMSDGLCVVVARSCHRRDVLVERQTSIEHDSQHLHVVGYWQIDSSH